MSNLLQYETSPYLLQHAGNPVHWMPYGNAAFEQAKQEQKPVLLSIGYSSCHWCHVMAHESFENEEIAKIMNEHFICIKVDREERPDVDQMYMDAVHLLQGNGGWPLNCFALPDGKPFWGGTYFKPDDWKAILLQIAEIYAKQQPELEEQATYLTSQIQQQALKQPDSGHQFSQKDLKLLFDHFLKQFDPRNGGFGRQPKFPMPVVLKFLLQYASFSKDETAKNHALLSLRQMAKGGIFDQVGGGFSRYSVDSEWHIPHFEKMLYDNAQLISLFADAYKITGELFFKDILLRTLDFVKREMTSPEGVFYSALDADSEGEEGKFYVWTKNDFDLALGHYSDLLGEYYSLDDRSLWENNENVLRRLHDDALFAQQHFLSEKELQALLKHANQLLLDYRNQRLRPLTDNKIIASWNALMISACADAYTALRDKTFLEMAEHAAGFFMEKLDSGEFFHTCNGATSQRFVFFDDYAFLAEALFKLYTLTGDELYFHKTQEIIERCFSDYSDEASGLFWFTSKNQPVPARSQETADQVIPASNSVMAQVLWEVGLFTDNSRYQDRSKQMLNALSGALKTQPFYYANWLTVAMEQWSDHTVVAVCGEQAMERLEELNAHYLPHVLRVGSEKESSLPYFENRFVEGETLIYICRGTSCLAPVETAAEALQLLNAQ